jgi:hypothetical protein
MRPWKRTAAIVVLSVAAPILVATAKAMLVHAVMRSYQVNWPEETLAGCREEELADARRDAAEFAVFLTPGTAFLVWWGTRRKRRATNDGAPARGE